MANKKKTTAVATTPAPKKPGKSLDENLKHLRDVLSVETLIEDINQEEALEFLDAVEADITGEITSYETQIEDMQKETAEFDFLHEKLSGLRHKDVDTERLLDLVNEVDSNAIREYVQSKGKGDFMLVRVTNLADQQKLETFLTENLYPLYSDQQVNIDL